ncbi:MAG: tail fiber domain-containing protein [Chitinophagales bacterium]
MKYFYTYLNFTLLFLFSFSAYSQKNVGIGEALPGTKLEIKGDAGTDLLNVKDQSDVSRLYVKENGNVGIGTPDPTEKLHLRGSSTTTGYPTIRLENTSGHTWHIWPIDGNDLRIRDVTDNEDRLTIKGVTGRVGIGTTNPGSKLEVHDATDIIANFKRTNGPSVGISLEGNNGDLTRIYGADKAFRIFHTPFGGTSTEVFTIERNGNANLTGSLSLQYGTAVNEFSIDGTLGGNSDNALPTEQAVKTYVDALVGDNTHWDKDGNNIYNNNSGNVGIGTPDPEEKLNISGNARISNQLFIGDEFSNKGVGSIQIRKEGASNGLTFWTETTGITTKRIWIDDATETMQLTHGAVAGEGLVIDNQGNVGIGMVSPGYKLDVAAGNGGIRIGPNSSFGEDLILGGWATSFSSARVATSNGNLHLDSKGGSNHIYLNHYHSGNIYLAAGSTQGQVGIGTPSPNYKLDVDGTGRYTGQLTIPLLPSAPAHAASKDYVDNQIAGTGDNLGNHTATTNINASDFEVQNVRAIQGKDWDDNSGGTDNKYRLLFRDGAHMFYNGGVAIGSYGNGTWADLADGNLIVKGNVGIGTTSPSASATANTAGSPVLQIGDNSGTPEIRLAGANSIGTSSKIVFDNSSTGDGMSIIFNSNNSATYGPDGFIFMDESNDNPRMKINRDNGHVGIGTTSPSTQLEVISSTTSTNSVAIRAEKEGNAGGSNYHTGFIGRASGHTDGGWYRGVYGNATRATADTDGRTYGVYGVAGNATSGWNYGVYGYLSGDNNGAAVYGSVKDFTTWPDVNTGGKWAGFFNGDVNLEGGLGIDGNKGSNGQVLTTDGTGVSWSDPNSLVDDEEDPTWNGDADDTGDISRDGKVGIGTASPKIKVHIEEISGGGLLNFSNPENGDVLVIGSTDIGDGESQSWFAPAEGGNWNFDKQFGYRPDYASDGSWYFDNGVVMATETGNVGIGTTDPNAKLQVNGDVQINGITDYSYSAFNGAEIPLSIWDNNDSYPYQKMIVMRNHHNSSVSGLRRMGMAFHLSRDNTTGESNKMGAITVESESAYSNSPSLNLWTSNSKRITVLSNGDVGIGLDNPNYQLQLSTSDAAKVGGGSWINPSDKRLKNDIKNYDEGLEKLLKIRPVKYKYNEKSGFETNEEHIGVIAQELKEVAPYMVGEFEQDGEKYLDVNNSAMTYMLINAVREQQQMIQNFQNKVKKQESEITALQSERCAIEQIQSENQQLRKEVEEIKEMLMMSANAK